MTNRYFQALKGAPYAKRIRLYRHRGTWAFYDGDGWMWCRQWGFKSELAALRAAARWLGREWRLLRARE